MDTLLIKSSPINDFPDLKQYRMPFVPHTPLTHLAKSARFIMHQFEREIKVWKFGKLSNEAIVQGQMDGTRLNSNPHRLLLNLKLDLNANIQCSAISDNGQWIAVSSIEGIKLFSLTSTDKSYKIDKIKSFPSEKLASAYTMLFSLDSSRLVISGLNGIIFVVSLVDMSVEYQFSHSQVVLSMCISKDGQWLALSSHSQQVIIMNMDSFKIHSELPKMDSPVTSICFDPSSTTLVITLASNLFYLYDIENTRFTDWTIEYIHKMPSRFVDRKDIIMGCAFDSSRPQTITLWGANYFCMIDLQKPVGTKEAYILNNNKRKEIQEAKLKQVPVKVDPNVICLDMEETEPDVFSQAFKMDHRYSPLLFLDFIEDEMVVVERPALQVMKSLPMSYYKHQYGT
jgi:U3 small nucleolar RNA-associated protein 4